MEPLHLEGRKGKTSGETELKEVKESNFREAAGVGKWWGGVGGQHPP